MRIVFTGGGTGGHVFPNVAVIRELRNKEFGISNFECFYIGGKKFVEEKIIRDEGIPFYGIHVGKLRRYWDIKNFIDFFKIPIGFFEALRILRKLKPDLVFAKGGYVSVPVTLAAWVLRISVWLHESDVSPGLANRICSRFAQKIWLSFEESRKWFEGSRIGERGTVEVIGNPIRKEMLHGSVEKGYKLTGFSGATKKLPVVLIMGGSSGAQSLNELVKKILPELLKKVQVIHITGFVIASHDVRRGEAISPRNNKNYKSFEFLHADLAHIYAITDLVISRAGSGAIFELLALKKPMILVPLPRFASRGDQIENARIFEKHGWATTVNQEKISPHEFLQVILRELHDKKRHPTQIQFTNAAEKIVQSILTFV